jgi:polyhydroxyalkanoate synthesis regulator phasin
VNLIKSGQPLAQSYKCWIFKTYSTNFWKGEKMKTALKIGLCVLIAGCLLNFAGCKKKAEPVATPAKSATNAAKPVANVRAEAAKAPAEQPKAAAPAADVKTEAAKTTAEQPKAAVTETVPVADVQAEAAKMNVEQLKAKAMEYKNLIVAKKATLETLAAKLKEIPIAQQMGAEAKGLQTDIATLNKSVSALTERFQVYYNKLKEMGGDVSGLTI